MFRSVLNRGILNDLVQGIRIFSRKIVRQANYPVLVPQSFSEMPTPNPRELPVLLPEDIVAQRISEENLNRSYILYFLKQPVLFRENKWPDNQEMYAVLREVLAGPHDASKQTLGLTSYAIPADRLKAVARRLVKEKKVEL